MEELNQNGKRAYFQNRGNYDQHRSRFEKKVAPTNHILLANSHSLTNLVAGLKENIKWCGRQDECDGAKNNCIDGDSGSNQICIN